MAIGTTRTAGEGLRVEATGAAQEPRTSGTRRKTFRVLSTLAVLVGAPLMLFGFSELVLMWLPADTVVSIIDDPELTASDVAVHRSHYNMIGVVSLLLWPTLMVQVRKPHKRVAAMLQGAAIPAAAAVIYLVAGGFVLADGLLLAVFGGLALLHPRTPAIFSRPTFDRGMLGLAAVAGVPWLLYAVHQAGLQFGAAPGDVHAAENHWAGAAVMAVAIIIAAVIGASDHDGWRLSAALVAMASVDVGAHALAFEGVASSLSAPWALAAIAWGLVFAGAAVARSRRERRHAVPQDPAPVGG